MLHLTRLLLVLGLWLPLLRAQGPAVLAAPAGGTAEAGGLLLAEGHAHLRAEDPVSALESFRAALVLLPDPIEPLLGLGEAWLLQGQGELARRYAEAARRLDPAEARADALLVNALLRLRRFDDAVAAARAGVGRHQDPPAALLAALATALFRVQANAEAARWYQAALVRDAGHAEAHLRLGSGLLPPHASPPTLELERGVAALQARDPQSARAHFAAAVRDQQGAVAHRLLGETLFSLRARDSFLAATPEFATLRALLPEPDLRAVPVERFLPGIDALAAERRGVAQRALALFAPHLPKLVAMGGRHDLLGALERTTDAPAREGLRGRRTFDGRVWDDVRGMGGLQAATGIEALDEAYEHGFDTLAHEVAHQAHLYSFAMADRLRIRELYRAARDAGRCLDYYAASNEAEYFAQGVEAFVSLVKRPGTEVTHGHTRFELRRVDPGLHELIQRLVRYDPLGRAEDRARLLPLAFALALRCGRPEDAREAAAMMDPGPQREALLRRAERAILVSRPL
ncbi:MAG: hypothetical protein IT458_02225 [Planctomycetes bacterium]|nr:hypothetical protein [Planctomycetota bacterium]